ncbi:nitroreductase family deazaflavin-dependent oxidoreductase [Nocardia stercoris]|uniref:Nitroreductase family deazaflavin-dependent oxidoreductase n=1 Tax=Nocardia stercoris TaxID=2483361 RepID=A0A3M2LCG6_9NOCA|nr:nitroreductase family deazaflavin-dependent oxidoreductase [Nocardia stercoris]RMI32388.1 nitroreductase family deazaflavin-dependent oxidoreductase [Nocardia stercoris]
MEHQPLARLGRFVAARPLTMRLRPVITAVEPWVRRLTGGRRGLLDLAGLPSLQLTVPGRRSGLLRTVSLLYVPHGPDTFVLVGSNWGRPEHPSWSANLNAVADAEINVGGDVFKVRVRRLTGADRDRMWRFVTDYWSGYGMEQRLARNRVFRMYELTRI